MSFKKSEVIRNFMVNKFPMTANEIWQNLNDPTIIKKFVAGFLATSEANGSVIVSFTRECRVSGRQCKAYSLPTQGQQQQQQQANNFWQWANSQQQNYQAKQTAPKQPKQRKPRETAEQKARREFIERQRQQQQQRAASQSSVITAQKARETFAKLTGYNGNDMAEAKKAYRLAALQHHPDRGGEAAVFAQLSAAWAIVQKNS